MKARLRRLVSWLLAPARRRRTLVATAGVVVLVVVATAVLWPRDDDGLTERVANAVTRPDPVSRGPIVTSIPPDCGLSESTINRLVGLAPGSETSDDPDHQTCAWDVGNLSYAIGSGTELEIGVWKAHERTLPARRLADTVTSFVQAVDSAQAGSSVTEVDEVHTVTGLGVDAVTWREDSDIEEPDTSVVFWQGNVLVQVRYGGGQASRSAADARKRVLLVAAEVARSMKLTVSGTPKIGKASDREVAAPPAACDLLPSSVTRDLGAPGETKGDPDKSYLFEDEAGSTGDGCDWGYDLTAEIETVPGTAFGTGERVASREYLTRYLAASSAVPDPDAEDGDVYTVPLRGLGDEAFASYQKETLAETEAVFRVRNTLVRITLRPTDDGGLDRREALDGVYRAAVAAAKKVKT